MSSQEQPTNAAGTPLPTFLTAAEVAEVLRLKPYTVHQLCKTGKIRATKHFGQWRITKADLEAAIRDAYEGAA